MGLLPIFQPDVEVSRNLRRHLLSIPGEPATLVFATTAQALDAMLAHGFEEFVLLIGTAYYFARPAQRSLLDTLESQLTQEPTGQPLPSTITKE